MQTYLKLYVDNDLKYQVEFYPTSFTNVQVSFKSDLWDYPMAEADIRKLKINSFNIESPAGSPAGAPGFTR